MKETLKWLFDTLWPITLITIIVAIIIRIYLIKKNNIKYVLYEEIISLSFLAYIMCLFYVVTCPEEYSSFTTNNLKPFKEIFRYEFLSRLYIKNVLGNLVMFIPLGFYLSYLLKIRKVYLILIINIFVSLSIELTQLLIGRVFDIDDIMLNVLGGLIGFYFYRMAHQLKNKYTKLFSNLFILTIMGISLFILLALVIILF